MKRWVVLGTAVLALAGVAGCSNGSTGQPEPATTTTPTSGAAGSSDPGTSPVVSNIADANACSLLIASEAQSLGLPSAGYTENAGAKSGCEWDGASYIVNVVIRTDVGLAGVLANGGTITDTTVGSHSAKQLTESAGGCMYAIGINNTTRVDVEAGPVSNSDPSCAETLKIAKLVEKRLP